MSRSKGDTRAGRTRRGSGHSQSGGASPGGCALPGGVRRRRGRRGGHERGLDDRGARRADRDPDEEARRRHRAHGADRYRRGPRRVHPRGLALLRRGPVLGSHGSSDPTVWLIIETITCRDGTVKLRLEPDPSPGLNQTGSWMIASGTGTFERLRGSGEMEAISQPDPTAPAHVTLTGTVTRSRSRKPRRHVGAGRRSSLTGSPRIGSSAVHASAAPVSGNDALERATSAFGQATSSIISTSSSTAYPWPQRTRPAPQPSA